MKNNTIKIDITVVKNLYKKWPENDFPCFYFCKNLLRNGENPDSRLEFWNFERDPPEADWIVPNIGKYIKDVEESRKKGVRWPVLIGF